MVAILITVAEETTSPLLLALLPLLGTLVGGLIAALASVWVARNQRESEREARQEARMERTRDQLNADLDEFDRITETQREWTFRAINAAIEGGVGLSLEEQAESAQVQIRAVAMASRIGDELLRATFNAYVGQLLTLEDSGSLTGDESLAFIDAMNAMITRVGQLRRGE